LLSWFRGELRAGRGIFTPGQYWQYRCAVGGTGCGAGELAGRVCRHRGRGLCGDVLASSTIAGRSGTQRFESGTGTEFLSDPIEKLETVPWSGSCRARKPGHFAIGKFLTDPIWWFYLFWLPRYLQSTFGLSLSSNRLAACDCVSVSTVGVSEADGFF